MNAATVKDITVGNLATRWSTSPAHLVHISRRGLLAVPWTEMDGHMTYRLEGVHAYEQAHTTDAATTDAATA